MSDHVMQVLMIVILLLAIALAVVAVILLRRSLKADGPPSLAGPKAAEVNADGSPRLSAPEIASGFATAMATLKRLVPTWNYRYRVPWYLLVGEEKSGKTKIFEHLDVSSFSPILPMGPPTSLTQRWRFLDQAIVINVPGEEFLALPGKSTDSRSWLTLLRFLKRYRPKRPLEGIVLTVPAGELMRAETEPDKPQRLARMEAIRERFSEAQQELGLNLPVYVLITKSDEIEGFSSFCGELSSDLQEDIFGWSNPHRLDTNFTSDWVTEAFDGIHQTLLQRQMEILADRRQFADADRVFLFPFELQKLREPIRVLLGRIFRASAYRDAPFLRGIYFSGIISPPDAMPATSLTLAGSSPVAPLLLSSPPSRSYLLQEAATPRLVFVQHLFDFKVFPEYRVAAKIATGFFSRNRLVLVAQILCCALVLLLGIATPLAYHRIGALQHGRIVPVLTQVKNTLNEIYISKSKPQSQMDPAFELMGSLSAIHQNEFRSWAMPYSLIDPVRRDLRATLEGAFGKVVLQACQSVLEQKIKDVSSSPAPTPQEILDSASALGKPFTSNPQYIKLQEYLAKVAALNQNIARYEVISQAGSGSMKELGDLMEYLGDRELPLKDRLAHDPYFERLVYDAHFTPLESQAVSKYQKETGQHTYNLITDFYQSWFCAENTPGADECPLIASLDSLQKKLKDLQSTTVPTNEDLQSLLHTVQSLDTTLRNGSYDWIAESFSRNTYPAIGPTLDAMPFADEKLKTTEEELKNAVEQEGTADQGKLLTKVLANKTILDVGNSRVRLNGPTRTLGVVLASLLDLDFMKDSQDAAATLSFRTSAGYVWNQAALNDATALYDTYSKTVNDMLPALPDEYRAPLEDVVDDRISEALYVAASEARIPNPNVRGQSAMQSPLDTELQNLDASIPRLENILQVLSNLGATKNEAQLRGNVDAQAISLLQRVDDELASVYVPQIPEAAWDGKKQLSLFLYQADSVEDLNVDLKAERQRIDSLVADASPVLQYLLSRRIHGKVPTAKWDAISKDIKQASTPGTPIPVLETFILAGLDKITPENGCKGYIAKKQSDVFLSRRDSLAQQAAEQCHQAAVTRYNDLADKFNHKLSWHFPFSAKVVPPEADPRDVAEFYAQLDQSSPGLAESLATASSETSKAIGFLKEMTDARPLLLGTGKDKLPILDLNVLFGANQDREVLGEEVADWTMLVGTQEIGQKALDPPLEKKVRWRFGDHIKVSLRYARSGPYVPAPSTAFSMQHDAIVFDFTNLWSLYALLQTHAPPQTEPSDLVAFTIANMFAPHQPVAGKSVAESTQVFIQTDLLSVAAKPEGPNEKLEFTPFPREAPVINLQAASHGD